jgi:hypothetical protein
MVITESTEQETLQFLRLAAPEDWNWVAFDEVKASRGTVPNFYGSKAASEAEVFCNDYNYDRY